MPLLDIDAPFRFRHGLVDHPLFTIEALADLADLGPGDGIHVPLHAPHWVENGPEPCVALAVTFHTAGLRRTERVHAFNAHRRRLGVHPRPPGRTRFVDAAKAAAIGGWEQTVGRLRKRNA